MNPDQPLNPREELELRVTALLLGELSEAEAASIRTEIAKDAELQKLHDDLKQTILLVREASVAANDSTPEQAEPLKLSEERRAKLRAAFIIPPLKPEHVRQAREVQRRLIGVLAVILLVGFLSAVILPSFSKARKTAQSNSIQNNLRLLDSAKQQWALEHPATTGENGPTVEDLKPYLGRGEPEQLLKSVAGEKYVAGTVDEPVTADLNGRKVTLGEERQLFAKTTQSAAKGGSDLSFRTWGTDAGRRATESQSESRGKSGNLRGFYDYESAPAPSASPAPAQSVTLGVEPKLAPPPTEIVLPKSSEREGDAFQVAGTSGITAGSDFFSSGGRGGGGAGAADASGSLQSRDIPVNYASPANIQSALQDSFADGRSQVVVDSEDRKVVTILGTDKDIQTAEQLVRKLDTPTKQVLVEQDLKEKRALGFDWYLGNALKDNNGVAATGGTAPSRVGTPSSADQLSVSPGTPSVDQSELGLNKSGNGTFALNGANTFNGGTVVSGGTLAVDHKTSDAITGKTWYQDSDGKRPAAAPETEKASESKRDLALRLPEGKAEQGILEAWEAPKFHDKVPVLGDQPMIGRLFRSEANVSVAPVREEVTIDGKKYEREFVGYDDPGGFAPQAQSAGNGTSAGLPITAALPLPHYRLRLIDQDAVAERSKALAEVGRNANATTQSKDRILSVEKTWESNIAGFGVDLGRQAGGPQSNAEATKAVNGDAGGKYDYSLIVSTNFIVGDPQWTGMLERPAKPSASNHFVSRYANVDVPDSKSIVLSDSESLARGKRGTDIVLPSTAAPANTPGQQVHDFDVADTVALGPKLAPDELYAKKAGDSKSQFTEYQLSGVSQITRKLEVRKPATPSAPDGLLTAGLRNSADSLNEDQKKSPLYSRNFKVDPNTFWMGLEGVEGISFGDSSGKGGGRGGGGGQSSGGLFGNATAVGTNGGLPFITQQQSVAAVQTATRNFFKSVGVDLNQPGKSVFFDDRQGTLIVRGTLEDLGIVDQAVQVLNTTSPGVEVKAKFSEIAARTNTVDAPLPRKRSTNAPVAQPEIQTSENNFSTFSLNVSDVSFKLAAASLEKGQMPDSASIRSEEFINAFDYRDPDPTVPLLGGARGGFSPIAFAWERARYPFAHNRDLLRFSLKTAAAGRQAGRPLNIVLLLDNSGSMERADRVSIIREALRVLATQLQPQDKLSVITFARTPRLVADGITGDKAGEVAEQVSGLTPEGGTNLEDAMNLGYQTAAKHFLANGINRVVVLTDGAANLGDVEPESLKQKVETQRKQGIALDCFGIGWDGFNDDLLEVLSRNGDGRYGFINSPEEAATEFAGQLAGALKVAASDVKVQVEFNPKRVTSYRQIGYAKHQLTKEQFRDNTVDAAEIAAQEAGNALYTVEVNPAGEGPLATVRCRYKVPGTTDYREMSWEVPFTGNAASLEQSSAAMRLATTASAFSEWLAVNPFAGEITPDALLNNLRGVPEAFGADPRPKKLEWMIRTAKSLEGK